MCGLGGQELCHRTDRLAQDDQAQSGTFSVSVLLLGFSEFAPKADYRGWRVQNQNNSSETPLRGRGAISFKLIAAPSLDRKPCRRPNAGDWLSVALPVPSLRHDLPPTLILD
jgi:hypothetical protein